MTITIIAGGRDFYLQPVHHAYLDALHAKLHVSEVVSGGATGADTGGEQWAAMRAIPVRRFDANWAKHGRSAGMKRNRVMARYADPGGAVVLFPGGRGTAGMREIGLNHGLKVYEYPATDSLGS